MNIELKTTLGKESFSTEGDETPGRTAIHVSDLPQDKIPLDVVFCVDVSGSMSSRISKAKKGMVQSLDSLTSADSFAVVSFSSSAKIEVSKTSGDNRKQAKSTIRSLSSGGGTSIEAGLKKSKEALDSMSSLGRTLTDSLGGGSDRLKWVVLLTDGGGNYGNLPTQLGNAGVRIHTAGIGSYRKNVVKTISEESQGEWHHCSTASEVQSFFEERIGYAKSVVAKDSEIRFEPANGAELSDVFQAVPQASDNTVRRKGSAFVASVPEIGGDVPPEFVFQLTVPPHERAASVTVARITLDVGSRSVTEEVSGGYSSMSLGVVEDVYDDTVSTVAGALAEKDPDRAEQIVSKMEEEVGETNTTKTVKNKLGIIKKSGGSAKEEHDLGTMVRKKRE